MSTVASQEFADTVKEVITIFAWIGGSIVALIAFVFLLGGLACLWEWAKKYWGNIDTSTKYVPNGPYNGYRDEGRKYENVYGKKARRKIVNAKRKQARKGKAGRRHKG